MAEQDSEWRSGEVLAFSEREGPGRPPAGPSKSMVGTLAGVLGVTFAGVVTSDTLCPDHRAWVQALGGFAFVAVVAAFIALWREWAAATSLTFVAGALGIAIGLLDAVHSPTRGRLVAVGFAIVTALAGAMTYRTWRLGRWDHSLDASTPVSGDTLAVNDRPVAEPAEAEKQDTPQP